MGQTLTIYAISEYQITGMSGCKRDDIYDALLTWPDLLDDIDTERREAAEDWDEDPSNILAVREALRHIIYDLDMDDQQSDVYAYTVQFLSEVASDHSFTDWYGRDVPGIFQEVDDLAKKRRIKLDGLDLIFHGNPVKIPDNPDVHIGFWDHRKCLKNQKILKKLMRKKPKKSTPEETLIYDRIAEMQNWVETTLKLHHGALVGILY